MLNSEPIINVPIDHSVAVDVKEGDYFGIKVKYAKKAGEVENLPELTSVQSDPDVVYFTIGGQTYTKRIDEVKHSDTAIYDTKGRKLADMMNSSDYEYAVQNYLDSKQLVQSVNSLTGNVVLTPASLGLENVNNTSDIDKPISRAVEAALNAKQDRIEAGSNIRIDGNVINALVDFSPLENRISSLQTETNSIASSTAVTNSALSAEIESRTEAEAELSSRVLAVETAATSTDNRIAELSQASADLADRVTELEEATESIVAESTIDAKIAEAMAAEQVQDNALKARIDSLEAEIEHYDDTELRDRIAVLEAENAQLKTRLTTAESAVSATSDRIAELESAIAAIDLSEYLKKEDADALYKGKAECNAQLADLQEQITNNIGRVLTEDPNENNRVWVEQ